MAVCVEMVVGGAPPATVISTQLASSKSNDVVKQKVVRKSDGRRRNKNVLTMQRRCEDEDLFWFEVMGDDDLTLNGRPFEEGLTPGEF
mgnify:CR=1 FL=1